MRKYLLLTLLLLLSCRDTLWNFPRSQWESALSTGDFSFLKGQDFTGVDLRSAKSLGPGALFYLSSHLDNPTRQSLLLLSMEEEEQPYRSWAAQALAQSARQNKDWRALESLSRRRLNFETEAPGVLEDLSEALYWQTKDQEVLSLLDDQPSLKPEALLWRAVAATRLDSPRASDYWTVFYTTLGASSLHYRAYTFFEQDPRRYQVLEAPLRPLVMFKGLVGEGQGRNLPAGILPEVPSRPSLLELQDWERYFLQTRDYRKGREVFLSWSSQAVGEPLARVYKALGEFSRRENRFDDAARYLRLGREASLGTPAEKPLFLLSLDFMETRAPQEIPRLLAQAGDFSLFSGELEELRSRWIREGRWELFARVWKVVAFRGDPQEKAAWGALMIRLSDLGLVPPELRVEDPSGLVTQILTWDPLGYPAFLLRTQRNIPWTPEVIPEDRGTPSPEAQPYLQAFRYGAGLVAYQRLWGPDSRQSPEILRAVAGQLGAGGRPLEAARLLIRARRASGGLLSLPDWKVLYPLAFQEELTAAAAGAGVDPLLFRALVREESFYDPAIKSPVGAVGLSQLMPATAEDMKKRLGLPLDGDLTNPELNLTIGAQYLSRRLKDFSLPSQALMAYNAGIGRIRAWQKDYGRLPADLFLEASPFPETRNYVKKIFVTAQIYRDLYSGTGPGALDLIYPGLR